MTKNDILRDKDRLRQFLFETAPIRGEWVSLNESYQTIMQQHDYPPVVRQLLGEALVAVSLLSATIKFDGRLTIQFRGKGKLKLLLAECNQAFDLRGLAQWEGGLTDVALWDDLHQGLLAIMMEPANPHSTRYQGMVSWQGQSFVESLEGYFRQSEQLPTRLWMAVDDHSAAGLLLQSMPKEKPEAHQHDWEHFITLTDTLTSAELLTLPDTVLLAKLYPEENLRLFDPHSIQFRCHCSVKRSANAILLLGRKEAEEELTTKKHIVITCEFCKREFVFDRADVANLFAGDHSSSSTGMH